MNDELEQLIQELTEVESFIPLSSGNNLVLLIDRKEQLIGRISDIRLQLGMHNIAPTAREVQDDTERDSTEL